MLFRSPCAPDRCACLRGSGGYRQLRREQFEDQIERLLLGGRLVDVIFFHENRADRSRGHGGIDQAPDARTDLVEAVANALVDIERDQLPVNLRRCRRCAAADRRIQICTSQTEFPCFLKRFAGRPRRRRAWRADRCPTKNRAALPPRDFPCLFRPEDQDGPI